MTTLLSRYLWGYYLRAYGEEQPLQQTLSLLLYWAFRKRILYFTKIPICFFIVVAIFFFTNLCQRNLGNVVEAFEKQNRELEGLKKMYSVGQNF